MTQGKTDGRVSGHKSGTKAASSAPATILLTRIYLSYTHRIPKLAPNSPDKHRKKMSCATSTPCTTIGRCVSMRK